MDPLSASPNQGLEISAPPAALRPVQLGTPCSSCKLEPLESLQTCGLPSPPPTKRCGEFLVVCPSQGGAWVLLRASLSPNRHCSPHHHRPACIRAQPCAPWACSGLASCHTRGRTHPWGLSSDTRHTRGREHAPYVATVTAFGLPLRDPLAALPSGSRRQSITWDVVTS